MTAEGSTRMKKILSKVITHHSEDTGESGLVAQVTRAHIFALASLVSLSQGTVRRGIPMSTVNLRPSSEEPRGTIIAS